MGAPVTLQRYISNNAILEAVFRRAFPAVRQWYSSVTGKGVASKSFVTTHESLRCGE